jgi:hypothetical protein
MEVWQSGLLQNPAKIPCQVIDTVGSNPTTSVGGAYLEYTGQIGGPYYYGPIRDANTRIEPGGNRR